MTGTIGKLTNREKVIYRTTTGIVCGVMVFSIIDFIFNDHFPFPNGAEGAFVHLGLPQYFKIELTTAKILGVLALLIPNVPFKIKEFAYFGFGITLISASIFALCKPYRSFRRGVLRPRPVLIRAPRVLPSTPHLFHKVERHAFRGQFGGLLVSGIHLCPQTSQTATRILAQPMRRLYSILS